MIWTAQRSTPSLAFTSGIVILFSSLYNHVCAGMAGGDRAQERDCRFGGCQTQKAVKLSYSIALLSQTDCGPQVLALPYLNTTQTYQTENILQSAMTTGHSCMLCICLTNTTQTRKQHINNQHVNNTQQPMWTTHNNQHVNNTHVNNTQPTHKQHTTNQHVNNTQPTNTWTTHKPQQLGSWWTLQSGHILIIAHHFYIISPSLVSFHRSTKITCFLFHDSVRVKFYY